MSIRYDVVHAQPSFVKGLPDGALWFKKKSALLSGAAGCSYFP